MATLLDGLDPDEWVYWNVDDKYPVELDLPWLRTFFARLPSLPDDLDGVCFFSRNSRALGAELAEKIFACEDSHLFWMPQFLRVRALQSIFAEFPDVIPTAGMMDGYLAKRTNRLRRGATKVNHAVFGESTIRGEQTLAFQQSAAALGITSTLPVSPYLAPTVYGTLRAPIPSS